MNDVLDEIDRAILTCLTQDARVSLKVLSARVGLTSPSTDMPQATAPPVPLRTGCSTMVTCG